jgi:hypothetical protein
MNKYRSIYYSCKIYSHRQNNKGIHEGYNIAPVRQIPMKMVTAIRKKIDIYRYNIITRNEMQKNNTSF